MAMVTLRSLMDRWETGDQDVLELVDQTFWQQGLDVDDDAREAMAASLLPDVRRLCRLCVGEGSDTRLWAMVLASLAPRKDPDARLPSLLQLMVLQSASDEIPLQEDLEAASCRLLQRFSTFVGAARQLRSIPSYALPFDMALAAAHGCNMLMGLELKDPTLLSLLGDLAQLPLDAEALGTGEDLEAFMFLAATVSGRAAKARSGAALAPGSVVAQGLKVSLGDEVDFEKGLEVADGRVVLLEKEQALVRDSSGQIRLLRRQQLFAPGSREALVHHRALLGLGPEAGAQEATRAFRQLAKQHHPDKGGDPETFRRLRVAFEALTLSPVRGTPPRSHAPAASSRQESPITPEAPRSVRRLRRKTPQEAEAAEAPAPKRHCRRPFVDPKAAELTVDGILQLIWRFAVGPA